MILEIEDIKKILPHRPPFLLIDRVIELDPAKKVVAIKNVTVNEEYFGGHFPDRPIMPGVLIIEAMAQAAIVLFHSKYSVPDEKAPAKPMVYYLGSVKVRFLQPVYPGDQLKITVEPAKMLTGAAIVNVSASVADKEIAKGELALSAKQIG